MDNSIKEFYNENIGQSINNYEASHAGRFNFLISDLKLNEISNSNVGDFGCGYAPIFQRVPKENNNIFFGFDGAAVEDVANNYCKYFITDLNLPFADKFLETNDKLDYAFCFETLEHLPNPYNCLAEIKKILKTDGIFYLSIPNESIRHNTIYPGLIYPVQNFFVFLRQMAFEIKDHRIHDRCFKQEVFTLINRSWDYSRMVWHNPQPKWQNISPLEYVNL